MGWSSILGKGVPFCKATRMTARWEDGKIRLTYRIADGEGHPDAFQKGRRMRSIFFSNLGTPFDVMSPWSQTFVRSQA